MIEIPIIETERLRLRGLKSADFDAEANFYASNRSEYVGGPLSRGQVWKLFAALIGHWELRGYGFWAVEEKETGTYCGHVGLWFPEDWPEPEIGWSLVAGAEGRGIAREAAEVARNYAFDTLGWTTAISMIDPSNLRSITLADKMGAVFDYDYQHPVLGAMKVWRHPKPEAH